MTIKKASWILISWKNDEYTGVSGNQLRKTIIK
jgi:hypothetical protein